VRSEVIIQRRFPVYDFVIRSTHPTNDVVARINGAIIPPRWRFSLFPSGQLVGRVEGSEFACHPETTFFGGGAGPSVRGEVTARADGGTDISIRAVYWFIFTVPAFFILLSIYFTVWPDTPDDRIGGLKMFAEVLIVAVILYSVEMVRVRHLLEEVFGLQRTSLYG
jgi:hypothetical protein